MASLLAFVREQLNQVKVLQRIYIGLHHSLPFLCKQPPHTYI